MWLMDVSSFILSWYNMSIADIRGVLVLFSLTINFVFATLIVYKGLNHPELFSEIEEKPKYTKSKLTREQSERYLKQLKDYMETKKPYLNPSLIFKKTG